MKPNSLQNKLNIINPCHLGYSRWTANKEEVQCLPSLRSPSEDQERQS